MGPQYFSLEPPRLILPATCGISTYRASQKKVAPKSFANFSEKAYYFNITFYTFILRFHAEQILTDFNNYKFRKFLVWPLSNFRVFKNVCIENLYNVKMVSTRLLLVGLNTRLKITADDVLYDVNFQNDNLGLLNNFLVITKTTQSDVEANQHVVSSSLLYKSES